MSLDKLFTYIVQVSKHGTILSASQLKEKYTSDDLEVFFNQSINQRDQFLSLVKGQSVSESLTQFHVSQDTHLEELQKMNNELVRMQRDMTKKNIELRNRNQQLLFHPITQLMSTNNGVQTVQNYLYEHQEHIGVLALLKMHIPEDLKYKYGLRIEEEYKIELTKRIQSLGTKEDICFHYEDNIIGIYLITYELNVEDVLNQLLQPFVYNEVICEYDISIGYTKRIPHDYQITKLFNEAEKALYHAERLGKNKYHCY